MITYNDIYEALRKEKYSEQLQALPKKFICQVSDYISEKKKLSNQTGDLFSEEIMKTKKQLENAVAIFNELMLLRKKKILGLVFVASETGISKADSANMMEFEKELFDNLIDSVKKAEKKLSQEFNRSGVSEIEKKYKMVLFLEDIEEIVGRDGEAVGPYNKGVVANIPREVAEILISDEKAEIVSED
jgi:DNA replication initiation complex subunit (GINS family)